MKFSITTYGIDSIRDDFARQVISELTSHGHVITDMNEKITFIFNLTSTKETEAVKRKSNAEYVVSIARLDPEEELKAQCYTTLVKSLSNLFIGILPGMNGGPAITWCITPEAGFFTFPFNPNKIFRVIIPIVSSHMFIRNFISANLPALPGSTTPAVEKLKHYGRQLDEIGVLPAPFPLTEVLSPENIEHLYNLFRVKGLSYGNLSIREKINGYPATSFWMTARGVDKSSLQGIGQDILLVTGYNLEEGTLHVSVPEKHDPRIRVSVDAIEHLLIYKNFPAIGAIVHVHAWMNDIISTKQIHPCGTIELAREVVQMLNKTIDPNQAVVGLKNHGITITGYNLDDIFDRLVKSIQKEVPMFL